MKHLLLALLLLTPFSAKAATITAADASYASVNAAVTAASSGDTVIIPSGSSTWTTKLTIAKNITLTSAGGRYATTIINGIHVTEWHGLAPIIEIQGAARITGLGLDGRWDTGGKCVIAYGDGARIDHCYFTRGYDRAIQVFGNIGLIDHNTFVDCFSPASFYSNFGPSWLLPLNLGTTNAWYFEDNYDRKTGAYSCPIGADGDWGTRYVWRFNVMSNMQSSGFDYVLDAHGNAGSIPPGTAGSKDGTVYVESYGNFNFLQQANRGNYFRGGTQIHYGNRYVANGGNILAWNPNAVFMLTEEDGYRSGNPIKTAWPAYEQITNSYFWNNTINGVAPANQGVVNENPSGPTDNIFIQAGRDYWTTAPSTTFYKPLRYPHPRILSDGDAGIPGAFGLNLPADGASVSPTPTLAWNMAAGDAGYTVQVATDYFFQNIAQAATVATHVTSYTLTSPLTTGTTYYWRVRANGSAGSTDSGTITTAEIRTMVPQSAVVTIPDTPSNTSPAIGATNQTLTLTLSASAYSGPGTFAAAEWIVSSGATVAWDSGQAAASTSISVPAGRLSYGTSYTFSVRYLSSNGQWSSYSPATAFITLSASPPATPTNSSPASGATNQTLTLSLTLGSYSDPQASAQAGAQFRVYASDGVSLIRDSGALGAVSSWSVPAGTLAYSTTYRWQGRYQSSLGLWSGYSSLTPFSTTNGPVYYPPATPSNSSPTDSATNVQLTPTLSASAFSDPQGLAQNASQWQVTASDGTTVVYDSGTVSAGVSWPVPASYLSYSTTYKWKARYRNAQSLWSGYSTLTSFTTTNAPVLPTYPPATPVNSSPAAGATLVSTSPTLTLGSYSDPQGAARDAANFVLYSLQGVAIHNSGTLGSVSSYAVPVVLANSTSYLWNGRYRSTNGLWSSFSVPTVFVTTNLPSYNPATNVQVITINGPSTLIIFRRQ